MDKEIFVSVIIPVYGVEQYIERCARSLFEQTLNNVEFIFVDDCSPDKSISILNQVLLEYPDRIANTKILHHEFNQGLPQARKTGFSRAIGQYVFQCDSDDWIDRNLLELMFLKAKDNNLDVVCCDCKNVYPNKYTITAAGYRTNIVDCISDMMYRKMWWSLCNKMFRRALLNNDICFPNDAMGEDMCLCLQLMYYAKTIGYVKGVYYNYYINSNSIVQVISKERCLQKYEQLSRNIHILKSFFNEKIQNGKWKKGLDYLSFYKSELLVPVLHDNEIRSIWNKANKGKSFGVFADRNVIIKQRIKAFLIWIRLFRYLR